MTSRSLAVRPASQCLHRTTQKRRHLLAPQCYRNLTSTTSLPADAAVTLETAKRGIDPLTLDPNKVFRGKSERLLLQHQHINPIGSRRRRALQSQAERDSLVPFEQMPYQCFQEARKVLAADREEKLSQIAEMRTRIGKVLEKPAETMGGEYVKKGKLVRMQKWLEELKVLADINDPIIRKRFEDGLGLWFLFSSGPCPIP